MRDQLKTKKFGVRFKIIKLLKDNIFVVYHIMSALLAYFVANCFIFSGLSPFGISVVASMPKKYRYSAAVGCALGYTYSINPLGNSKYLFALAAVLIIARVIPPKISLRFQSYIMPLCAFVCVLGASFAASWQGEINFYKAILIVCEAALSMGSTYFFIKAVKVCQNGSVNPIFEKTELSCVIVAFAIVVMSITPFEIARMSVGRIIAVWVILLFASSKNEMAGAVAGTAAGAVMSLAGSQYGFLTGSYGIGGLVAGVFSTFGKLGTAIAFASVNAIATLIYAKEYYMVFTLYEVLAASVLFMLTPSVAINKMTAIVRPPESDNGQTKSIMISKLSFARRALDEIARTTKAVTEKLSYSQLPTITQVYDDTCERVCSKCKKRSECWSLRYGDTVGAISDYINEIKQNAGDAVDSLPQEFTARCVYPEEFASAISRSYFRYLKSAHGARKSNELSTLINEQFGSVATILRQFEQEMWEFSKPDNALRPHIAQYFERRGTQVSDVICYRNRDDQLTIEALIPSYKVSRIVGEDTLVELEQLCQTALSAPVVTQFDSSSRVRYNQKANFDIKWAKTQIAAKGKVCGDSVTQLVCDGHRAYMVISDGQGSGPKAAIDSTIAIGLLTTLIRAGIGLDASLGLINCALLSRSGEEEIATLDVSCIDLYTARTSFHKAGAAPAYVRRAGKVGTVESTSLPVGIISDVAFETTILTLDEDDLIVMVSDGAAVSGEDEWIIEEIGKFEGDDVQAFCEHLANMARGKMLEGHEDDVTVAVAVIGRGA